MDKRLFKTLNLIRLRMYLREMPKDKIFNHDADDENDKDSRGNPHLPFGLCKREGIKLPSDATPRDAWEAYTKKTGITAKQAFKEVEKHSTIKNIKQNNIPARPPKLTADLIDKLMEMEYNFSVMSENGRVAYNNGRFTLNGVLSNTKDVQSTLNDLLSSNADCKIRVDVPEEKKPKRTPQNKETPKKPVEPKPAPTPEEPKPEPVTPTPEEPVAPVEPTPTEDKPYANAKVQTGEVSENERKRQQAIYESVANREAASEDGLDFQKLPLKAIMAVIKGDLAVKDRKSTGGIYCSADELHASIENTLNMCESPFLFGKYKDTLEKAGYSNPDLFDKVEKSLDGKKKQGHKSEEEYNALRKLMQYDVNSISRDDFKDWAGNDIFYETAFCFVDGFAMSQYIPLEQSDKAINKMYNSLISPLPSWHSDIYHCDVWKSMKNQMVAFCKEKPRPVKKLKSPLSEDDIISRLAGGDKTGGSCASLAIAYMANKKGYDVLDFKGGYSRKFFALFDEYIYSAKSKTTLRRDLPPSRAYKLLKDEIRENEKEYIFSYARHTAIVKKDKNGKLKLLELQNENLKGWRDFEGAEESATDFLKRRFGYRADRNDVTLCPLDDINIDEDFLDVLAYINTAE